jgi:hypothetical protein
MAKGQKRSNREAKKPKQQKAKAVASTGIATPPVRPDTALKPKRK